MRPLLTLAALLLLAARAAAPPLPPPALERQVRALLLADDYKPARAKLLALGAKAHPVFKHVLADDRAKPLELIRLLDHLAAAKLGSAAFRDLAVARLDDPQKSVRAAACAYLARAGTAADTSPLVALLNDEDDTVVRAAADALAALGTRRDVWALDAWLRGVAHKDDRQLRAYITRARDLLKRRLADPRKK